MSEEKPKKGKMKIAGYACIIFAAVLSLLIVFTKVVEADETLPLIYYWGGLGMALLFGNAGKRIGGQAVMNKAPQPTGN